MEIVSMKLDDLNPAEYNPRKALAPGDVEYKQIKQSILTFGMVEPIVWNRRTGNVVGGHQRLAVLRDLGYESTCVSVIDVSESQEKALNIALNKITGEWDDDKLSALLEELSEDADQMLITLTGFTDEELDEMFASADEGFPPSAEDTDLDSEEFDVDSAFEAAHAPITRRGDIYLLGGKHRLMCGDSTRTEDIDRLMDGKSARLTVTDPPYNVDYNGKTKDAMKIQNDCMKDDDFYKFLLASFRNIERVSEPGATVYIFHADSEGLNFRRAFNDSGFKVRQCLVWVKNSLVLGRQDYQWKHEPILYGWKDGDAHYFVDDRTQTTVIEHDRPTVNKEHPTMKPVSLVGLLIQNSSKEGWTVLDPFGGSGSTLIAADKLGRSCYTMELEEKYCDVIVRRYIEQAGSSYGVQVIRDGETLTYEAVSAHE